MLSRRAMTLLAKAAGLDTLPSRFHHSNVYNNPVVRALGLDDGYHFLVRP